MAAPSVAAIVVHYRVPEDTRECIHALLRAQGPLQVVFVDNSGCGEGRALVTREFPALETLDAGPNRGWAAGTNVGVRAALAIGATHVLFVNADATVAPDFLAPMVEACTPDVGIVTGKILLPRDAGAPRIWAAGGHIDRLRSVGVNEGEGEFDGPRFDAPRDVDFATGCLALVRREVFERVGLLDERLYLYMEDVDFSERVANAGFRLRYEPRATAVHRVHGAVGGTREAPGPVTTYYLTRNRFLYARERLRGTARAVALARLVVTRGAKVVADLARGRHARARLIVRASLDGLRGVTGETLGNPAASWPA